MADTGSLDPLWQPLKVGSLQLHNRLFVSAHGVGFNDEDIVGDRYIAYYEERARGGVGLLVTGAEGVHSTGWHPPHFQAWREDAAPRYQRLADAVHRHGSRVFTQLWHCGLQDFGSVLVDNNHPVLGPSAVPSPVYGRIAKAMEQEDIDIVIDAFARAAELARDAGIDGVEVAGAHGYLISNFLSELNNRREDHYGGSVANRCRLAIEVGTEIRRRVGDDFPVGFRMVFEEYAGEGGFRPETSKQLLSEIHKARVFDYFNISGGTYHSQWATSPLMTAAVGTPFVPHAAIAREVVQADVPIAVAGGIYTVDRAASILAAGEADLIAMTRAHMADPELVRKAREGRVSEIRRCVGANQGCIRRQVSGGPSGCTVNPAVGREMRWGVTKIARAAAPRHIQVVGGGPAGLKLAEIAAQRGHRVTLVERSTALGGQARYAASLPNRGRWFEFIEDLVGSVQRNGVEVQLNVEATAESVKASAADLTVLATGSSYDKSGFSVLRSDRRGIPGAEQSGVLDPVDVLTDPSRCGKRVVIVDDVGDHAALGVAQLLAEDAREVHLITMGLFVGALAATTFEVPAIYYPMLVGCGVQFLPSTTVEAIEVDRVRVRDIWSRAERTIPVDTVVLNMLRKPRDELYRELRSSGAPVRRIGDCVAPRYIDEALYEAMELGLGLEAALLEAGAQPALA